MSLFDKDLDKRSLAQFVQQLLKNVSVGEILVCPNVQVVCVENNEDFNNLFEPHIHTTDPKTLTKQLITHNVVTIATISPDDNNKAIPLILKKQAGRPFIEIDCSKLGKGDAIGSLHTLSLLSSEKKPVVVISNISEIPKEGQNIDDPGYTEELLLHGWKESLRQLIDNSALPFTIRTQDYTIIIPLLETQGNNINLSRLRTDGFCRVNLKDEIRRESGKAIIDNDELDHYTKLGWLSDANVQLIKSYFKSIENN